MTCNCGCGDTHRITDVTVNTTEVILTAVNSTDIGDLQKFNIFMNKSITGITGVPIPVFINVNGTNMPLKNRFGQQILSNRVPLGFSKGYYVADSAAETPAPYVILLSTPPICNYA